MDIYISITAAPAPPQSFLCGLPKHRVSIFYSSSRTIFLLERSLPSSSLLFCGDCCYVLRCSLKNPTVGQFQPILSCSKTQEPGAFTPTHRCDVPPRGQIHSSTCDEDISVLIQVTRSGSGETKLFATAVFVFLRRKLRRSTRFTSGN